MCVACGRAHPVDRYYKKASKTCKDWVSEDPEKRCGKKGEGDVRAYAACLSTCGQCEGDPAPAPTARPTECEDSTSWYCKKSKNTCADYVTKKTKNCEKTDDFDVPAQVACPVTCGECEGPPVPAPTARPTECEDSTSWYYKKSKNTCADYVSKKTKNCKKTDDFDVPAQVACPVTCDEC